MLAHFLLVVTLTSLGCVNGDLYSTCYPSEIYCLFSFGPNVKVNNVSEAQKVCEDAKNGSWLLEIADNRTLKNVNEFLSEHSFPQETKLILNVGTQNQSDVNNNLTSLNDVQFYQRAKQMGHNTKENYQFSFICMTGCSSNFEHHQLKRFHGATQHKDKTLNQCREECEVSVCEAYEWENNRNAAHGCWIHASIQGRKMVDNKDGSLYIINRSVKSSDICVGKVTRTSFYADLTTVIIKLILGFNQTALMKIVLTCVIPTIVVIAITVIVVVILWRRNINRRKKNDEISIQNPYISSINATYEPDPVQIRLSTENEYEFTNNYSTIDAADEHVYMHLKYPPTRSTC